MFIVKCNIGVCIVLGISQIHCSIQYFFNNITHTFVVPDSQQTPCTFNFAVPSEKTLSAHTKDFKVDASKPGVLECALDAFAKAHPDADCKLSLDGKKLAYGFGKVLGDEDLDGNEEKPTLLERQTAFNNEQKDIQSVGDYVSHQLLAEETLQTLVESEREVLKSKLLSSIGILSRHVKDLREMSQKKTRALSFLKDKVVGNWRESKFATSISFLQTKIVKTKACIHSLLECIDDCGYYVSYLNGTSHHYVRGFNTKLYFSEQSNSACLSNLNPTLCDDKMANSSVIKQHSQMWHELRSKASVTGSSWYRSIGLSTLKEMKEQHDKSHLKPISPELQTCFDYGNANEINGAATLVGKFLPVYYPEMLYREDGCEVIKLKDGSFAISSGDGICVNKDVKNCIAVEIKCPMPGKQHSTDVTYKLPERYSIQVLAEMASKNCGSYVNVCFSPASTTFVMGDHDEYLWKNVIDATEELYCSGKPMPCHRPENTKILKEKLKSFASKSSFIAEFPSLQGVSCECQQPETTPTDAFRTHTGSSAEPIETDHVRAEHVIDMAEKASDKHKSSYDLMRRPAKEVLVVVISDLDRLRCDDSQHAAPIAYYLSGFSLKMVSVRSIIRELLDACKKRNLNVKAICFDGQFLDLATSDDSGRPLTVCKLQKHHWNAVRTLTKRDILNYFADKTSFPAIKTTDDLQLNCKIDRNETGSLSIVSRSVRKPLLTQPHILRLLKIETVDKGKSTSSSESDTVMDDENTDFILQHLPSNIVEALDEESLNLIQSASSKIHDKQRVLQENSKTEQSSSPKPFAQALCGLYISESESLFQVVSEEDFKEMVKDGESIDKNFTIANLKAILTCLDRPFKSSAKKIELVQMVSSILGDNSIPASKNRKKSPPSLKTLAFKTVSNFSVLALRALYCGNTFEDKLKSWCAGNEFRNGTLIESDDGVSLTIPLWYAQPTVYPFGNVQMIIDPHHLFVNNRSRVCSHGMPGMEIRKEAWIKVAEESRTNGTNLSLELVVEMRDRQRNSFAQTTFSEKVENEMEKLGFESEAQWCGRLRRWYQAVDEAGISVNERIRRLIEMRNFLLCQYNPFRFPPPGGYINSLPMSQYEGIMTNIDRRLQLFKMVRHSSYNQRSVSSLDSETFFSTFQVCYNYQVMPH